MLVNDRTAYFLPVHDIIVFELTAQVLIRKRFINTNQIKLDYRLSWWRSVKAA